MIEKCISIDKLIELKNDFYNYGHYDLYDLGMFLEDIKEHFYDAIVIPDKGVGELSDGYHTFNELYHHRAVLFSVICNLNPEKAWKSKLHDSGDMFDGMFIVGIDTPQGQATYHYDIEPYWNLFKVKELERAPKWDGHTSQQAIERIAEVETDVAEVKYGEWKPCFEDWRKQIEGDECSACGFQHYGASIRHYHYCPNCGAKMDSKKKEGE